MTANKIIAIYFSDGSYSKQYFASLTNYLFACGFLKNDTSCLEKNILYKPTRQNLLSPDP